MSSRFSRYDLISRNCRHEDVHQYALSHNDSIRFIIVYFDLLKEFLATCFFAYFEFWNLEYTRSYSIWSVVKSSYMLNKYQFALIYNVFVTSKNKTTNLPIHEYNVLHFFMVYYFLLIILRDILSIAFSFLNALKYILQYFRFVNWWIRGFV